MIYPTSLDKNIYISPYVSFTIYTDEIVFHNTLYRNTVKLKLEKSKSLFLMECLNNGITNSYLIDYLTSIFNNKVLSHKIFDYLINSNIIE